MSVSVVVPSWNVRAHLRACLRALETHAPGLEVVVVDDASSDGSADLVAAEFPAARLIRSTQNEGYARATNTGAAASSGDYLLLLNADCEVGPGTVARLVAFLDAQPEYGAAAPCLLNPDGSRQRACMRFPRLCTALWSGTPLERWWPASAELERYFHRDFDHAHDADVEQPPAACLLVRRAVFEDLGGLDEDLALYFNDVDFSKRLARSGLRTRFVAGATALHHVGASTRLHPDRLLAWHRDRLAYYRKHYGALSGLLVKGCVLWTSLDFFARQALERARGRRAEPSLPVLRQLGTFLIA